MRTAETTLTGYVYELYGDRRRHAYAEIKLTREHATITFHPPTSVFGDSFPTQFLLVDRMYHSQAVLVGCFASNISGFGEVRSAIVNRALLFHHPIAPDETVPLEFKHATASIRGLREWMNVNIRQRPRSIIEATLGDLQCKASALPGNSIEIMATHAEISAGVAITSENAKDPDFWQDAFLWFGHLVSICAGQACVWYDLDVETDEHTAEFWAPMHSELPEEVPVSQNWAFVLGTDESASAQIIQRWFAARKNIGTFANLFMEEWVRPTSVIEFRYISLLQGLESYHRMVFAGRDRYLDQDEYREVYKTVSSAIPSHLEDEHKESLGNRLKFGNEYSLRRRLKGLLIHHKDAASALMTAFGFKKTETWIDTIVKLRNELTHNSGPWAGFKNEYRHIGARCFEVHLLSWYLLLYEALGDQQRALTALRRTQEFRQVDHLRQTSRHYWSAPSAKDVDAGEPKGDKVDMVDKVDNTPRPEGPLPQGLGNSIMSELGLKPGKEVGYLREALTNLCETGEIEREREFSYYIEVIRSRNLLEACRPAAAATAMLNPSTALAGPTTTPTTSETADP